MVELGLSVGRKSMSLTFVHHHLEIVYSVTFFTGSLFSQAASECTRSFSEGKMWTTAPKWLFSLENNGLEKVWILLETVDILCTGLLKKGLTWTMCGGGEELEIQKLFGLVQSGVKLTS